MRFDKVISGGQTGVDRAALDAAMAKGIPVGGFCPQGRRAEDGPIPDRYPLVELPSPEYVARTERNVIASDGTLVLNLGELSGGTALTVEFARLHGKPCLVVRLDSNDADQPRVVEWAIANGICILNVAGPRESKMPGQVYSKAFEFLSILFQ